MKKKNIRNGAIVSKLLCLLLVLAPVMGACGEDSGRDLRAEREQKEEKKKDDAEPTKKEEPKEKDELRTEPEEAPIEEPEPTEAADPTEEAEPTEAPAVDETELMSYATQDLDGNSMTLGDLIRKNDLTMLNIWGTFCGPCINEMPGLATCAEKYADRGFAIVGLTCDVLDWNGNVDPSVVADDDRRISESGGPMKKDTDAACGNKRKYGKRRLLTVILLLLSIAAFIFGIVRGEPNTVYRKGANICMECIGIG